MTIPTNNRPEPRHSPLHPDADARLPAAAYLRYENRADGWSAGRQAAFLAHLADNGLVADAARCVGMSLGGAYALRRTARGYAFNLGWEAALIIARRIVADNLMTVAIKGEQSMWVREEGVTTYTRQNMRVSLALLDRVNPATALPEVVAVATRFDCFLDMIDDGLGAQQLWEYFFDEALPHEQTEARARVRAALQLCEESAVSEEGAEDADSNGDAPCAGGDEDEPPIEYKSMDGPPSAAPGQAQNLFYMRRNSTAPCAFASYQTLARRRSPEPLLCDVRAPVPSAALRCGAFFLPAAKSV